MNTSCDKLESLPRDKTVFFFPVGPIEDHGPHLPMGLDMLEARHLAELLANKTEKELLGWHSVIMPSVPLGVDSNTTHFALTVRAHVLRDYLLDTSKNLSKRKFRYFVCVSGHLGPRQLTTIEEAGKMLGTPFHLFRRNTRRLLLSASSALPGPKDVKRAPLFPNPDEHGGGRDTSVALAIDSDMVDPSFRSLLLINKKRSNIIRMLLRRMGKISGYWGAPAVASKEDGAHTLEETINQLFPKLRLVLEGAPPKSLFRSWYSVIPSNKSLFKVWVLIIVLALVLLSWVFLTYKFLR